MLTRSLSCLNNSTKIFRNTLVTGCKPPPKISPIGPVLCASTGFSRPSSDRRSKSSMDFQHNIGLSPLFTLSNASFSRKRSISENLILYGDEAAPPVRFVMMTAFFLGIELEFRSIDLFASENRTESYKNINPLQKVPSMVTENQKLCDSHVISLYLCRKWDAEYELYPQDDMIKAKVDEILFFNSSTLFPIDSEIFSKLFAGSTAWENRIKDWYKALDYLEQRLKEQHWLAGDRMMLCDICAVSTVTTMLCLKPLADHHVRLRQWLTEFEEQPFFNINKKGLERLKKFITAVKN